LLYWYFHIIFHLFDCDPWKQPVFLIANRIELSLEMVAVEKERDGGKMSE
jgi:hypothetical protein